MDHFSFTCVAQLALSPHSKKAPGLGWGLPERTLPVLTASVRVLDGIDIRMLPTFVN